MLLEEMDHDTDVDTNLIKRLCPRIDWVVFGKKNISWQVCLSRQIVWAKSERKRGQGNYCSNYLASRLCGIGL